jgi:hypothetical protein
MVIHTFLGIALRVSQLFMPGIPCSAFAELIGSSGQNRPAMRGLNQNRRAKARFG